MMSKVRGLTQKSISSACESKRSGGGCNCDDFSSAALATDTMRVVLNKPAAVRSRLFFNTWRRVGISNFQCSLTSGTTSTRSSSEYHVQCNSKMQFCNVHHAFLLSGHQFLHSVANSRQSSRITDYTCVSLNITQAIIMKKNLVCFCLGLGLVALTGCEVHLETGADGKIVASGKTVTEKRTVTPFTAIENDSFFQVVVTAGDKDDVEISGDEKLVPQVETVVENQRLIIRNKSKTYSFSWKNNPGTINITAAHLQRLENAGSGDVDLRGLNADSFDLKSNSSGDMKVSGKIQSLSVASSGSGDVSLGNLAIGRANIELNGSGDMNVDAISESLSLRLNGSGSFEARSLHDTKVNLQLRGSGNTTLMGAIKEFKVEASGSGDLDVKGLNVAQADLQLFGPGEVRLAGEVQFLTMNMSGSGDVETNDLHAKSVVLKNQGPANVSLRIDQNLKAELSGSGDLNATISGGDKIDIVMNGPGTTSLSGTADSLVAKVNGSGDLHARDLLLRTASIKVNGSGEAAVNVKQDNGPRVVRIDRNGVVS